MSTYRVDNHQPQNVYRGEQYIGVMFTAEDAALAVEALNGTPASQTAAQCAKCGNARAACQDCGERAQCGEPWCAGCQPEEGWLTSETVSAAAIADVLAIVDAPYRPGLDVRLEDDDSCICATTRDGRGIDPACPVHQGRRARGPKPPPLGPGCICDGSGRTCPRHGAVM